MDNNLTQEEREILGIMGRAEVPCFVGIYSKDSSIYAELEKRGYLRSIRSAFGTEYIITTDGEEYLKNERQ